MSTPAPPPPPNKPSGAPSEISAVLDLSDLVLELDDIDGDAPPLLTEKPSALWGFSSGMYSDLISLGGPTDADAAARLAEEFADEAAQVEDPEMKAALTCEAGRVLFDRLGRMEDGELLMRNSKSPIGEQLLSLNREGTDSLAESLRELEAKARNAELDPADRCAAWVEFGLLCDDRAGDGARALEAYERALAIEPEHAIALALASDTAIALGQAAAARGYIERRLTTASDPLVTVALLLDMAELAEDPAERRAILERAHAADPEEETALRRLIRVVAESGDRESLTAHYQKLARISEDPYSVATALHLAFLNALEANIDPTALVEELSQMARVAPGDEGEMLAPMIEVALHIEQRIASGREDHITRDLDLLGRVAESLDAPRERALMQLQMARVTLDEIRQALPTPPPPHEELDPELRTRIEKVTKDLEFCLEHLPQDHWIFEALAELLELRGRVEQLAILLQSWARVRTAGPGRARVLSRLGRVHEELRRDLPRAAEMYELALAEDPDDSDALRALGRVYEKMRRWPQAIANLQRQARQAEDTPDRLRALRRVATMAQHELNDPDLAIATFEEIISLDPDDLLSTHALAALAREQGRANVLVETLRSLVTRLDDDVARTAALVELGEVLELQLKRRDEAQKSYEGALEATPGYMPALRALARIYRDEGDLEALLSLHEPEVDSVTDPAVLALKAARVCQDELGDLDRAIGYLDRAYKTNPDLVPARELLLQLLTATGRIREAYDLLRAQDDPKTPALLADRQYHLGLLAEAVARQHEPEDPEHLSLSDAALQHHRLALKIQPDHGLAFERCRRLLVAMNDRPNLAGLLRDQAELSAGTQKAAILVQLARIHSARPDETLLAREALEAASEAAPSDFFARRELETLLRRDRDMESLPSVYLAAARHCSDTHLKATLLVEAAELLLRSNRSEDRGLAGESILEALSVDPGNPYAVRHLERLLGEPDAPLLAREAVAARAVRAQSDAERAIFYLESAELLERARAYGQARRAYEAALGAVPDLMPAELGVARVLDRREDDGAGSREEAGPTSLHVLMAEAREAAAQAGATGNAADGARAVSILREIFECHPNHRDAVALTRALTGALADPSPAVMLLVSALDSMTDPRQRYDLALFLAEQTQEPEAAIAFLTTANEARPEGREALRRLIVGYQRLSRDADAAAAAERLLALYADDDPSALDLRLDLANFLSNDPATLSRALKHAQIVSTSRPDDPRVGDLMATLLERSGDSMQAVEYIDRLIPRERDRGALHTLHLRRASLLSSVPGRAEDALRSASTAVSMNPGHRGTLQIFAGLADAAGRRDLLEEQLPNIRAAFMAKVGRGALSMRDLGALRDIASDIQPALAKSTYAVIHAIDPQMGPPPADHLVPVTRDHIDALLKDPERRAQLLAGGESPGIHELLNTVEVALPRLLPEFISLDADDLVPVPPTTDVTGLGPVVTRWSAAFGVPAPLPHGATAHNACVLLPGDPPVLRVGTNLWMQGDLDAWRGLAALSFARTIIGAPLARSLVPIEMDLLLAAAFDTVRVFNAITADPDPRRLGPLTTGLGRHLSRKLKRQLEDVCHGLSGTDLVPSATAKATLASDFRFALMLTGDVRGCLSAACLLDGVAGGNLKARINRSVTAQGLVNWILSDAYASVRN